MTSITLEIEESKAAALRLKAARCGVRPEELLSAAIDDLIGQPDGEFDKVAKRVLAKNEDLYRRLA